MLHRADQLAVGKGVVPGELDPPDFDFRSFIHLKDEHDGVARCNALVFGRDLGELMPVLPEQLLQHDLSLLDPRGIELALHGEPHLAILVALENVGLGYRVNAVITDAADHRPLLDVENDDLAPRVLRAVLDAQLDVFEELGVPQGLKIAPQRLFTVGIADAAENSGFQCVAADPAIADKVDPLDRDRLRSLRVQKARRTHTCNQKEQQADGSTPCIARSLEQTHRQRCALGPLVSRNPFLCSRRRNQSFTAEATKP